MEFKNIKDTKLKLIKKGLTEPKTRFFDSSSKSYLKMWSCGDFLLKISPKGRVFVYEKKYGEFIKIIYNETVLDAFIVFAKS